MFPSIKQNRSFPRSDIAFQPYSRTTGDLFTVVRVLLVKVLSAATFSETGPDKVEFQLIYACKTSCDDGMACRLGKVES